MASEDQLTVVVMAAGQGTRMRSALPKVLHPVCGRPMVRWVVEAARAGGAHRVVCVVRPGSDVEQALPDFVETVEQTTGEGTGACVLAARERVEPDATVVVLSGDHPLVSPGLVADLAATHTGERAAATLLTTEELDPAGYGRIVRAPDGAVERIVETKRPEEVEPGHLAIREVNIGAYAFAAGPLFEALDAVRETGGERYLTGVFPLLRERGMKVAALRTGDVTSAMGVNSQSDLIELEAVARRRLVEAHALVGVRFVAPETIALDAGVEIGPDTTIDVGAVLRGETRVGTGCAIGPHTTLVDARLGDDVVAPHSYLTGCEVGDRVSVGPYAYLRPGAVVEEDAKIGTFVEIKGSRIGRGAKIPHLSYIGDADVGEGTNIGAGNITANYDGFRKHRTVIGANVRTGSDTVFVAPVRVGDGAWTGAGSVITRDVPDGALGIGRASQKNIPGYAERRRPEE